MSLSRPMAHTSVATARLRAMSASERRATVLAAYRQHGALDRAAHALGVPPRTLGRMVRSDHVLREALDAERNSATSQDTV